jgi:hypothetical protein
MHAQGRYVRDMTLFLWRMGAQILFFADCGRWPVDCDYRRPGCEANPFNRMAMPLEVLGFYPLMHGFEAELRQSGRMRQE